MNPFLCPLPSSFPAASSSVPSLCHLPVPPVASPNLQGTRRPRGRPSAPSTVLSASRMDDGDGGADSGGRLGDEDMILLRKRLHEMQAAERNNEPPSHWMDWEKRYYHARYGDDVCHLVGVLQALLMNARPSAALGMLALVALSVPTSTGFVLLNLVASIKALDAGIF